MQTLSVMRGPTVYLSRSLSHRSHFNHLYPSHSCSAATYAYIKESILNKTLKVLCLRLDL